MLTTPYRLSESEGSALLSYFLHHEHGCNTQSKLDVLSNCIENLPMIASYFKKVKEEFLSLTSGAAYLASKNFRVAFLTAKRRGAGLSTLIFEECLISLL